MELAESNLHRIKIKKLKQNLREIKKEKQNKNRRNGF